MHLLQNKSEKIAYNNQKEADGKSMETSKQIKWKPDIFKQPTQRMNGQSQERCQIDMWRCDQCLSPRQSYSYKS